MEQESKIRGAGTPNKKRYIYLFLLNIILLCGLNSFSLAAALPLGGAGFTPPDPVSIQGEYYSLPQEQHSGPEDLQGNRGDTLLALHITPREGTYIYAPEKQGAGLPTRIGATTPEGEPLALRVIFPEGNEKEDPWQDGARVRVYDQAFVAAVLLARAQIPPSGLTVKISGLSCAPRNCTPFSMYIPMAAPEAEPLPSVTEQNPLPLFTSALATAQAYPQDLQAPNALAQLRPAYFSPALEVSSLGKALLLGFLAGIILNLMPCVLPVLGLKFSALLGGLQQTDAILRRKSFILHQLFFAAGILGWFTMLGLILGGASLVWGELFQSRYLVLGLMLLLFLLALNLFGVFSLPMFDLGGKSENPRLRAFSSGFFATLLATPCSGPLLGGVLAWALLQSPIIMLITLWSVGLGMALPYLLLILKPELLLHLPRPGAWMRVLEQILGFMLLGAVLYFLSLLPEDRIIRALIGLLLAALAAWIWGRKDPREGLKASLKAGIPALPLLALALFWPLGLPANLSFALPGQREAELTWLDYTESVFNSEFGERPVLLEFTADWCPSCKIMDATTLSPANLSARQKLYSFVPLRVDLSRDNPEGQALLRRLGSVSIPLIALFPAGETANEPLVLRDLVTPGQLDEAMERVLGKSGLRPVPHKGSEAP